MAKRASSVATLCGRSSGSTPPSDPRFPPPRPAMPPNAHDAWRNMPVTTGMKDGGFYDRNSSPQWNSIAAVLPWLIEALGNLEISDSQAPIALADFGCSEGANSIRALQPIV